MHTRAGIWTQARGKKWNCANRHNHSATQASCEARKFHMNWRNLPYGINNISNCHSHPLATLWKRMEYFQVQFRHKDNIFRGLQPITVSPTKPTDILTQIFFQKNGHIFGDGVSVPIIKPIKNVCVFWEKGNATFRVKFFLRCSPNDILTRLVGKNN